MSTTLKKELKQLVETTGQKLTAVRVVDIILNISHPKAIEFGGYDSIATIFYTILEDNTIVYEYKTGPYEGQELDKKFIEPWTT